MGIEAAPVPPPPPPPPAAPANGRIFCPVRGCMHSDEQNARGWSSHGAMRPHLNEHCSGRFMGRIPQDYMDAHNFQFCRHCGQLVNQRFNGCCPRCRPHIRVQERMIPREEGADDPADLLPSLEQILQLNIKIFKYVPRGARDPWAQSLARATAQVVARNDLILKVFFMMSKCILACPKRQGKKGKDQTILMIRNRAQRWLNGERESLWNELLDLVPQHRAHPKNDNEAWKTWIRIACVDSTASFFCRCS